MARATRKSLKSKSVESDDEVSRNPSSLQTPESSDIEEPPRPVKRKRTTRGVTQDSDADESPLAKKSRSQVYVELVAKNTSIPSAASKGKGKARATLPPESDSELEYNKDFENSSGSEFDPSDFAADSDDEAAMLRVTIEQSRVEVHASQSAPSTSAASRLRSTRSMGLNMDMDLDLDNDPLTDISSSSEEEPLATTKKGKGKGKAPKRPKDKNPKKPKRVPTQAAQVREKQAALVKELGRKLTHAEKGSIALQYHHPELADVWDAVPPNPLLKNPIEAPQPDNLKLTLLPFQRESLHWMQLQEGGEWKGGMLADEMGMGKTIQIIALLVSAGRKPNLVVAPTVAIMQWRNEIQTHTEGLKVCVWHGASRSSNINELKKHDVVLTTYAVLESAFRKQEKGFVRKGLKITEKSPVHQIVWDRIILDEAHNIKERSTNTAKAAFELQANAKWCLSGTPLQNRVGELYSLVRFLGGDPFSYYFCKQCPCKSLHWKFTDKRTCDDCGHSPMHHTCFWNNEILSPIQKHGMEGPGEYAFQKLRKLLDRMMLRRTKLQRADDLGLPPRTVIVRRDFFSPEEKELYLSLFSDAKRQFTTYLDHGTVLNNYSNIFSLLTRMRQMACHPDLVLRSKTNSKQFVEEMEEEAVCRLCNEFAEDAIQSRCHHVFDRECVKSYLSVAGGTPDCPVCHLPLTIDLSAPALDMSELMKDGSGKGNVVRQGMLGRLNLDTWRSSTKIEMLVEELSKLREGDASTKSIVFSQFVNFLDLVAWRLKKAGFNICRLEGTMSPQARDLTIQHFMNNVNVTVFLVSLKAGGVALNLTEASRVYLMDSWWNPAVEYQAMDRIHRLGQRRPVQAIKLVVEDSIESRIVQLQEKKSAMVDATLSTDDQAMGKLTPEDLGFLFRL